MKNNTYIVNAKTVFFFDLDGTLVETNYANFLAYEIAIESVIRSKQELIYNPNLRFNRSLLKKSFPNITEVYFENIIIEKEKHFEKFLNETRIITKNVDILKKYSQTNKVVLVTNCRIDRALSILKYYGLTDNFHEIFCREFGENEQKINKYQNAISVLDVPPNRIIAFEDEQTEIEDAIEAGIKIINPNLNDL